eukprot:TRINITY_DN5205_c0_g1_i1.p1 TRINITY_DN5205_c0_g1~~TRINITY_DN5205_c0_g1_i1.p1  ORF type:complete len:142 (+),score=23.81 TRINITY_DN5205_c0_g1_i1:236-661(+)
MIRNIWTKRQKLRLRSTSRVYRYNRTNMSTMVLLRYSSFGNMKDDDQIYKDYASSGNRDLMGLNLSDRGNVLADEIKRESSIEDKRQKIEQLKKIVGQVREKDDEEKRRKQGEMKRIWEANRAKYGGTGSNNNNNGGNVYY